MDKKNTIILTVIAVATLLVAVVGATFAYFTAQMGPGTNTNITVTTSTQDTLSYGSFSALYIIADQDNFGPEDGTPKGTAGGTISLQANSNNPDEFNAVSYCYTATINVALNQFEYAPEDVISATDATGTDPELVLSISKNSHVYGNGEIDGLTYKDTIGSKNVCDQTTLGKNTTDCKTEEIKGYDITVYGNTTKTPDAQKAIKIPYLDADEPDKSDPVKKYAHKISASEAGAITTDNWSASLYFVNYGWDQQYNTHKMFTATWDFETVDCATGLPKTD